MNYGTRYCCDGGGWFALLSILHSSDEHLIEPTLEVVI